MFRNHMCPFVLHVFVGFYAKGGEEVEEAFVELFAAW